MATATTIAATPSIATEARQPRAAIASAAVAPTTTVPTLPPATWAAIAVPIRRGGNCSASSALPTGCCGAPPIRETTFATANPAKPAVIAWAAIPAPVSSPPPPRSTGRPMYRVRTPNAYWSSPLAMPPIVDRMTTVAAVTPNSSMTAR